MNKLWISWTINCALGELLGIAAAGGIAYALNSTIGEPQVLGTKNLVLLTMMFAGLVEGAILGFFQWKVLVNKFTNVPKREWMFYTIIVGILGWFLGMLPSLFFSSSNPSATQANNLDFYNPILFAILSVGSGAILGSIFGLFQWFSLRKYAKKSYKWIIANALGWALGLGWIYLFASLPSEKSSMLFTVFMGMCAGILAGISVGAVTGFFLIQLEKKKPCQNNFQQGQTNNVIKKQF